MGRPRELSSNGPDGQGQSLARIPTPREWQGWNRKLTWTYEEDRLFVTDLIGRYGLPDGTKGTKTRRPFGRAEFFSAVREMRNHVLQVRESMDRDHPAPEAEPIDEIEYKKVERRRPSTQRIEDLCLMFLHIPPVKIASGDIHIEKFSRAFPEFRALISQLPPEDVPSRDVYLNRAASQMTYAMINVLDVFDPQGLDDLTVLLGYENDGILIPANKRRLYFADFGIGTFYDGVLKVVHEAMEQGVDIAQHTRGEFLDNTGVLNQLMRVSLIDIGRLGKLPLNEARRRLSRRTHQQGMCPAFRPMEGFEGMDDEEVMRDVIGQQIAYSYAQAMLNDMTTRGLI